MTLHTHPFKITIKIAKIILYRQPCETCLFPVTNRPIENLYFVPLNVSILKQRNQIIRHRTQNSVLKIQDTRVGRCHHQVTRMIIPMYKNSGLRQVILQNTRKDFSQYCFLTLTQIYAQMFSDVPVGKKIQFITQ